jgi:hypothetical protein
MVNIFLGREIREQGHNQSPQIAPIFIHGERPGYAGLRFTHQLRLHALEQRCFATADEPRDGHALALGDRRLQLHIELLILRRFKKPRLAEIAVQAMIVHHISEHRGYLRSVG